jgi:hypothetical protein
MITNGNADYSDESANEERELYEWRVISQQWHAVLFPELI